MTGSAEVMQRLVVAGGLIGTALCLVLALAGARRGRATRRRGARLTDSGTCGHPRRPSARPADRDGVRRWATSLAAGAACWFLIGGGVGGGVGCAVAYGIWRWQQSEGARRAATAAKAADASVAARLPLVADLLAACLSAGAGPQEAAEAVGESLDGPVGARLARAAAEIRLGGEPSDAWGRFGEIPGAAPLARCLERAGATGAPAAEPVSRLADEMRAERASAAVARAQRAGVLITAPVGLCFLPAFLAVGVAPVVIGLATGLLQRN
ncbi:type II secretion system F family protein [Streptomyces halstedii]|uniref:type II secretion system F family protein n=1 Tax=Streptomyces halstedii TaxID=1944 RepID=UPI00365B74A5